MKTLAEVASQSLKWVQPSVLKMNYELRAGDEIAGTLRFRSSFGSFATGESADGCWTFKRVGFWQTRVTIRASGNEEDQATFANKTWSGGGTLTLRDGRSFRLTTSFWQTQLELQDEAEHALVRFKTGGVIHQSATVEIDSSAAKLLELPWMVMLCWYLIVMMHRDTTAAAAG